MLSLLFATLTTSCAAAPTFDVYRPGKAKAPIVIFVHGGAWVGGTKAQYKNVGEGLAAAGFCAAVIDYHLAPAFKHPRPVEDLESARRALGQTENCDGTRVAMIGHSAGAHALAFWATRHAEPIRALVGLEGIYDLPKLAVRWPSYPEWFLNAAFGAAKGWPAASPTRLTLKNKAPWLVVHAAGDELVDPAQSADFTAHVKQSKIAVENFDPGALAHVDVVEQLADATSPIARRVAEFITKAVK